MMLRDIVKKGLMIVGAITVTSIALDAITAVTKKALAKNNTPIRCACFCVGDDDDDADFDDFDDCDKQEYTVDPDDEGSMPFEE